MNKKYILIFLLQLLAIATYADKQGKCGDDVSFLFSSSTGTLMIEGNGTMKNYGEIETKPWGEYRLKIKNVIIKEGVTSVGSHAFKEHSNLSSVTIPNSVTYIGEAAFYDCSRLASVNIPEGVTSISNYTFTNCFSLTSVTIPDGVTIIKKYAFYGCRDLGSITIPANVKTIEKCAFYNCTSLTTVTFPNGMEKIGPKSFYNCPLKKFEGFIVSDQIEEGNAPLVALIDNDSFSYFVTSRILKEINQWQNKGEFETTQQYHIRVNETTREAKVKELMDKARQQFLDRAKKGLPRFTLGKYDADREEFILSNIKYGEKSVKVSLKDAPTFKEKFSSATYNPTFVVKDDKAELSDLGISLCGKTYMVVNPIQQDGSADVAINLPPLSLEFGDNNISIDAPSTPIDYSIDQNIPITNATNPNTFAVIIGNENYKRVSKVLYAQNDARSFAEYCKKTLGLPEKNVRGYEDATYGLMVSALQDIKKIAQAYHGDINVIFYYAGHGIPDNASKEAYLLPVDADGRQMDICVSINKLYQELGSLEAKSVMVFLDACFSGALRGDGMLIAVRGVAIKPKTSSPQGRMVVFSAATDEQTAFPYTEKGHGMFTYYLLKKIRETKGECTLGELSTYICDEVAKQSIVTNGREQTPTTRSSASVTDSWRNLKLK